MNAAADALENMAEEVYSLIVEGEGGADSPGCAARIALFSKQAASWAAAGKRDHTQRCLQRAMAYSAALEAQVAAPGPCERQEEKVIALFSLYLEGAKSAADNRQQALANNLLSRAVSLSRHAAIGPDAMLCCAVGIAELQLSQAHAMLDSGGTMSSLAAALLSSSYQQLCSKSLADAAASGSPHATGLLDAKKQVLMLLCRAHLASGDSLAASKALDSLELLCPGAAAAAPAGRVLCVDVRLAAGRVPEALRFLTSCFAERLQDDSLSCAAAEPGAGTAPAALAGGEAVAAFLAGLKQALRYISEENLPSFQSAVSGFVWKATATGAAAPEALLALVQALLAQEETQALCQRLVLQALANDDVSAALHSKAAVLAQVHALLWHHAAQRFEGFAPAAAKELFAAAFQFARPEARAKTARALATCHSRLGMHQRAAEWLDIAAHHEQQPSSLTQLARLQQLVLTGDAPQAIATIRRFASSACSDFHISLLPALCQAAAGAQQPDVYKEAVGAAVQALISGEGPGASATLPPGQEAALLLAQVQAIDACLKAARAQAVSAAGPADSGTAALLSELTAAVKLAAQRVKQLGWRAFAGGEDGSAAVQALCAIAYNQLLAAQHSGAHEHAVALATAMVSLLPLVDRHLLNDEVSGAEGQAKVLLLAAQALLDVHQRDLTSPKALALAAKLQLRVAQAIASLPASKHLPLHLLYHCLCLETSARRGDGAAILHALGQLQPHAAQLAAPQRRRILAALCGEPSAVVREAACSLLLASMTAGGGLEAAALGPAMLTRLVLPAEQQLRALASCRQLLAAIDQDSRGSVWTDHCKWLAAHAWNAGGSLARSASSADGCGSNCAAQLLAEAVKLRALCGPDGDAVLQRMQSALAASALAGSVQQQRDPTAGPVDAQGTQPAASTQSDAARSPVAARLSAMQTLLPQQGAEGSDSHGKQGPLVAASGCPVRAPDALPVAAADVCVADVVAGAVPAATAAPAEASVQAARCPAQPATAASAGGSAGMPAPLSAHAGSRSASLPVAAVQATATADADMLSDSDGDDAGNPTWLEAVFAAQKRVLGSSAAGPVPAKRRALQPQALAVPNHKHVRAVPAVGVQLRGPMPPALAQTGQIHAVQEPSAKPLPENAADSADALSLCSS